MAMAVSEIEAMIRDALPDARVEVRDLAGDGNHYAATVVSPAFKGKSRVQQHKMVYDALQGHMGGALHALALEGPVAGLVGIEGGVVSGVSNLESPGVSAPGRRPRHDKRYHEA